MQNHTLAQFWDCGLNNCAKSHSCTISVQHRPSWRFCIFKTHLPLDYYHHYWLHYSFWLSQSILLFVKLKESRRRMLMKLVLRQQHRLGLQVGEIIFVFKSSNENHMRIGKSTWTPQRGNTYVLHNLRCNCWIISNGFIILKCGFEANVILKVKVKTKVWHNLLAGCWILECGFEAKVKAFGGPP